MNTKYIFISGGVISGIGKGVTAASIAVLLQAQGYKVTPVKSENYLNVDAGTINPIEHGDPFLCEDGTEADMDLGTYEKFLDKNILRHNFMTLGQVYQTVIDRERRFEYKGEDVEAIPYITDEISHRWIDAGTKDSADIVLVELGGTAGEYQNVFYYEAARQLSLRNPGDVIHIHVGYMPTPSHLGEPKTKPIQLSVRTLNGMGIQPDIIVARSEKPMDQRRKDRFALFCNVHPDDVITVPDAQIVYDVPITMRDQGICHRVLSKLGLEERKLELSSWETFTEKTKLVTTMDKKVHIAIVGKYFATGEYQLKDSYAALFDALQHAGWHKRVNIVTHWIDAENVEKTGMEKYMKDMDGIIVPIGWGERGFEGMITAASYARTHKIPYLGLCYGMQIACIAYARDVLGWADATSEENNKTSPHKVIHLMKGQEEAMKRRAYGGTMRLGAWEAVVKKDTLAWEIYDKHNSFIDKEKGLTSERHRHRYEFNDEFAEDFEKAGFVISARSKVENLAEIIELPRSTHPFYIGTQGHPEYKSRPLSPHPIFVEYIASCIT